ncbi:MAG: Lrp/AsnC ligand binding domain-containing protein [Ignisphaera sp.]|nr:Lrp/AsnC ligand binding domain-containing protein [Ignisphaera sp.]MDW8084727.1 Lrp/AsnC ligand binding domain-containing protein [Ignisphaera sp.]
MKAFVEIGVEPGTLELVLESIRKIEGVKEAYPVTGHCDIIAVVEVAELKLISEIVVKHIHRIKGVKYTQTLLVVE